jgi:hypothetical protein
MGNGDEGAEKSDGYPCLEECQFCQLFSYFFLDVSHIKTRVPCRYLGEIYDSIIDLIDLIDFLFFHHLPMQPFGFLFF